MVNYEQMYKGLFNGITNALHHMEEQNYGLAKMTLMEAQQKAEDNFIEAGEEMEL